MAKRRKEARQLSTKHHGGCVIVTSNQSLQSPRKQNLQLIGDKNLASDKFEDAIVAYTEALGCINVVCDKTFGVSLQKKCNLLLRRSYAHYMLGREEYHKTVRVLSNTCVLAWF